MNDLKILVKIKNNLILEKAKALWGEELSQKEIARRLKITPQTFGHYLNFKEFPLTKLKTREEFEDDYYWKEKALDIAKGLNCLPQEIFPEHLLETRKSQYEFEMDSETALMLSYGDTEAHRPDLLFEKREISRLLEKALATLTPREEHILKERFGLIDGNPKTLEDLAIEYGIRRERIRQIGNKALRKIRHPSRSKKLRAFYDKSSSNEL